MRKIAVIGCGAYMDSGYGCPGEWRCLKAAALGEGSFSEASSVVAFLKCQCPGRSTVANLGMAARLSELELDAVHLSSCLTNSRPGCPYFKPEELASLIEEKTSLEVTLGSHDYH
jgi:predicted metal-binding protein